VLVFKKLVNKPGLFPNTPFVVRGNHFLVHGTEKGFTLVFMFHLFKYVVIIRVRIRHPAS